MTYETISMFYALNELDFIPPAMMIFIRGSTYVVNMFTAVNFMRFFLF